MILMAITKNDILRYMFFPQVAPRIKDFISSGFSNLAYFMALVYRAVNLLPASHPYLQTGSIGKFGIRNVLSEAANNLVFSAKHIDQIIIFFALIAGIAILAVQFLLLLAVMFINPASAAEMPTNYSDFFKTANPENDIALRLLDSVFGVPKIFGSSELGDTETAFHTALHGLFQFYSVGLLVIAVMIVIYFIFAILAETAQTGTPFGKRYNHAWAPIRLVAAIGLLIPISYGMNSGQWITLYAAKFGSGFATNGWNKFNEGLRDFITPEELVAKPNIPSLKDVSAFMMMAHACNAGFIKVDNGFEEGDIDAWLISADGAVDPKPLSSTLFSDAVEHAAGKNILIRIGKKSDEYTEHAGNVYPHCGEITLINDRPIDTDEEGTEIISGEQLITARYYLLMKDMWLKNNPTYTKMAEQAKEMMLNRLDHDPKDDPEPELKEEIVSAATKHIEDWIDNAAELLIRDFRKDKEYQEYGWGGAAIWYNKIADVNGKMTNGLMNKPQIVKYPDAMQFVCKKKQQQDKVVDPKNCYNPRASKGKDIYFVSVKDEAIASALSDVFDYWHKDPDGQTGNAFIDTINVILGTQGLFDMCKNADIHPLAQLSSVGKGLVEAAIRNLGFAMGTGAAGILTPYFGPTLSAASSFLVTVASIGILIGFILYYLIPFMPFLYFLFAVGGWVKGLFEAMVGVPLWALAHLRIDGNGLPGDAGLNGYFLVFEIFLRPILIIFGLLASILIFGAMVKVLNEIFYLVVSNLSGFDSSSIESGCGIGGSKDGKSSGSPVGGIDFLRGPVDEFFFTIVYAILVYMIGMSSFKLIDLIPNNILRWMGAGVSTYNDQSGEPAEGLVSKMAIGGGIMGQQLQSAGSSFGQAVGGLGAAIKGK